MGEVTYIIGQRIDGRNRIRFSKPTVVHMLLLPENEFDDAVSVHKVFDYLALLALESLSLFNWVKAFFGYFILVRLKLVFTSALDFGNDKVLVISECLFDHHRER
jgi:hypothetical protein